MKFRIVSLALSVTCALLGTSGCIRIESKSAAAERKQHAASEKRTARVTEFRSKIANASCNDVVTTYRMSRHQMDDFGASTAKDTRVALAKRFLECKKSAELFSCAGNTMGEHFDAAEKEGVDVMDALKGYLASGDRKGIFQVEACFDDDGYSSRAVYKWLQGRKDDLCADFVRAMESGDPMTRASIVDGYLLPKSCDGGAKLAVKGLQADAVWAKESTCTYLGKYGDASQIGDIETVARAHSERVFLNNGREVVPVRDVCMQAAASLRLKKNEAPTAASVKPPK